MGRPAAGSEAVLDATDRAIINGLQGGFPLTETPFADAAETFGIGEEELMTRIDRLAEDRLISRFGPMYNAERLGGALSLCALAVPEARYDEVADQVNAHDEVAHNYARAHDLNMWFVIATERPEQKDAVLEKIGQETGLKVYDFPKIEEFFIGLKVEV
jgi:DNA-binding Lrp family transcriptional regulator